jgi:hypothetical protein
MGSELRDYLILSGKMHHKRKNIGEQRARDRIDSRPLRHTKPAQPRLKRRTALLKNVETSNNES